MTPAARAEAAIAILDRILAGDAAEASLLRWSRASRFAGSGDRAAVRDLVFDCLRRLRSRAALGGALTGRGLILGMCREQATDPDLIFNAQPHAPAPLTQAECVSARPPTPSEALDLPEWISLRWRDALGPVADEVARAMQDRAPVWLRVNGLRATPADAQAALLQGGVETEAHETRATALRVTSGARKIASSRAYTEGLVELQDLSPQLACAMLPAASSILDYCAGGGGKALALAAANQCEITAHDADAARMRDLPARAKRANARIKIAAPGSVRGQFDLVVADVPCSGSGTWRRTPDAKWRLDQAQLTRLLALQARILNEAAQHVAVGGYLAYMTCSLFRDENRQQVDAFLQQNTLELIDERLFTPIDASDGFYVAILVRR